MKNLTLTIMSDKEFIQLLHEKGFTPYNYQNYWDDIEDYFTDNDIDPATNPDKYFEEIFGQWETVYEANEISEVRVVVHFEKFDKYVLADGYHNSYESMSEWDEAVWHIAEPYQFTETKYRVKK